MTWKSGSAAALTVGSLLPATPEGTSWYIGTATAQEIGSKIQAGFVPPIVVNRPRTSGGTWEDALIGWVQEAAQNFYTGGKSFVSTALAATTYAAMPTPETPNTFLTPGYYRSGGDMSLNLGGLVGGIGTILGGISNPYAQGLGTIASAFSGALSAPTPSYAIAPYNPPVMYPSSPAPVAQPVGAFSVPAAVGAAMTARLAPILAKMAVKLGLKARPSLNRAMEIVRKAAKLLGSPEAVAVALGLTTAELAQLITTSSSKKRRRMNPANSHALRRAARRIKSFHKLCTHTDLLKTRHRSAPRYAFQRRKCK